MVFYVTALYKGYFQRYGFVDTAFYAINITTPVRLKHICAVGLCQRSCKSIITNILSGNANATVSVSAVKFLQTLH